MPHQRFDQQFVDKIATFHRQARTKMVVLEAAIKALEPEFFPHQNGHPAENIKLLPEELSRESASPPLYMKVKAWSSNQVRLMYQGNPVFTTVEIQGEKNWKVQSINPNQEVIIIDYTHSSFLFYPDEEDKLQVYVKPIKEASHWLTGIPVLAKYLQLVPDV